jgi:hypothetical protein
MRKISVLIGLLVMMFTLPALAGIFSSAPPDKPIDFGTALMKDISKGNVGEYEKYIHPEIVEYLKAKHRVSKLTNEILKKEIEQYIWIPWECTKGWMIQPGGRMADGSEVQIVVIPVRDPNKPCSTFGYPSPFVVSLKKFGSGYRLYFH